MLRRTFILGSLAATTTLPSFAATNSSQLMRISGLWVRGPYSGGNVLNQVKGTLYFRLNNERSDRALNSYGAGTSVNSPRQCVELIRRYAALLGFSGFSTGQGDMASGRGSVGNGHEAAARFAASSSGGFVPCSNGSSTLPKPGAVLSILGWDAVPAGHTGILCNYDPPSSRTDVFQVKLFDENMPIDSWKDIRFTRRRGGWNAEMLNRGVYISATGWANPSG